MPLLIVSISRRVQGLETLAHFAIIEGSLSGGTVCVGCGTHIWDRVSPVELSDGGALDPDSTWDCSPLCRVCSYRSASRIVGGPGWSGLGSGDVAAVWDAVRDEQARELENELSRERATALDELQAAQATRAKVTSRVAQVIGGRQ